MQTNRRFFAIIAMFSIAFLAYAGLLNKAYDLNIVQWVVSVRNPNFNDPNFFYPQHLLHLTSVYGWVKLLGLFRYTPGLIPSMQLLSAVTGSLSAVFVLLIFHEITKDLVISFIMAVGAVFSYGNWTLYTDAWYYPLGILFILICLWMIIKMPSWTFGVRNPIRPKTKWFYLAFAGLFFSLAVLCSQITILYLPGLLVAIFFQSRQLTRLEKIYELVFFTISSGLLIISTYFLVGFVFLDFNRPGQFISWIFNTHARLPGWLSFNFERITRISINLFASFLPIHTGLGLRALIRGELNLSKLIPQTSVLFFILFLIGLCIFTIVYRKQLWQKYTNIIVISIVLFIPITVFAAWLEPDAVWAMMPIFVLWLWAGLVAVVIKQHSKLKGRFWVELLLLAPVITLLLGNLVGAVYPRHVDYPLRYYKAAQAADLISEKDIILSLSYDSWVGYLPLFNKRGSDLVMISRGEMTKNQVLDYINNLIQNTHQTGGKVYIIDASMNTEEQWRWLDQYAGLAFTLQDFEQLTKNFGWQFNDGENVWEIIP